MPELPEVETVARGIHDATVNHVIANIELRRAGLRFPFPPNLKSALLGQKIKLVTRRAKYILIHFYNSPLVVVWHLGMSGQVLIFDVISTPIDIQKHDHVILTLENQTQIRFRDPRRFGFIKLLPFKQVEETINVGVEPLSPAFNQEYMQWQFAGKKQAIKLALLNQKIIAGIGNIYACEALLRAQIDPWKPAGHLNEQELERLVLEIQSVLLAAIASGGSSLKDHVQVNGKMGYFQHQFISYGRAGKDCLQCQKGVILRKNHGGRSTFYCPVCQPAEK